MAKRVFRIRVGEPLLDIVSYGSAALHENGGRLSPEQVEHLRREVDPLSWTFFAVGISGTPRVKLPPRAAAI